MRWLRYCGLALGVVLLLLLVVLGAAWTTASRSKSIGELYAKRSYPNLTAAACVRNKQKCNLVEEAPIAALAEYRRCGEVVSGTRIRGEPLGCSEIGLTDRLMRDFFNPGQTTYRQLRRGCRKHDLCYRHGRATYGHDPKQCDEEFLAESLRECWLIYGNDSDEKDASPFVRERDFLRWSCQARAAAAYIGVSWRGGQYFKRPDSSLCEYEGGPHAARDHVVAGRFLGGPSETALDYVISLSLTPDETALTVRLLSFGPDGQSVERAALTITPGDVAVADRDWACPARRRKADGGFADECPEHLGQSLHKGAAEWLRFPPIVVDADGDGSDELVIPSLVPDFGLIFTHIRAKQDGDVDGFEPARAFLAPARLAKDDGAIKGCETGLEFADCYGALHGTSAKFLSSEAANQHLGFEFTVMASPDAGCAPEGRPGKQDVVLLSTFSDLPEKPTPEVVKRWGWDSDYVLRRFVFDAQAQRWYMRRDRFNNDRHRLAGCTTKRGRDQFQTHARLQYPAFAVRMPPTKDTSAVSPQVCASEEQLALISRDKCATTSPVSRAGSLFDIDVMLYKLDPKYTLVTDEEKREKYKEGSGFDDLRMAEVKWLPVLWPETADPVVTSRAARERGVAMVSTYIGGTTTVGTGEVSQKGVKDVPREGQHPVVAVVRDEHLRTPLFFWQNRYADTMGHAPELYGVFKSTSFKPSPEFPRTLSEQRYNLWDPHRYGSAQLYFRLPSVLAPFTSDGAKGVGVVYFGNSALWASFPDPDPRASPRLSIRDGWFRLLIVTVEPQSAASGHMVDCPADAIAGGTAVPARQSRGYADFLQREPVLVGKFLASDAGGSLAVAWRDAAGDLRLTALRREQQKWKFGDRDCEGPDGFQNIELYRGRIN